ncbi:MAG TPA: ABC transporter ATP-binding protein [Cyanothece sp. UBA12306]|nr:ABC transporter ATP-binding protein [Cyanothece sp. UBA12306]
MSDTIIKVENLGKKYIIRHQVEKKLRYVALRDVIANGVKSIWKSFQNPQSSTRKDQEEFWALKDVSFEVKQGEAIGIIGRNGAGKSTLLKILSQITEPTRGRISLRGRVASLLEVGTGFHPELTGRENIYLNGAILGMTRTEIKRKFDEIVAFAEVEKFLDTPVKRYSSGMYVRLAFSVAAHLEPEILVVDEVLAVGDAAFQKKCLGKMGDVAQKEGRTVLFVSHNMGTIKSLCNSAILLTKGCLVKQGLTSEVIDSYLTSSQGKGVDSGEIYWKEPTEAPGGVEMRLISIRLLGTDNLVKSHLDPTQALQIEINYQMFQTIWGMRLVIRVVNTEGIVAFTSTDHDARTQPSKPGLYRTVCLIHPCLLNAGVYFIQFCVDCPGIKVLIENQEFLSLFVEKSIHHGSSFPEPWPGVIAPKLQWKTEVINSEQ